MKRSNIRILATGLFLSVCGLALGSAALSTPAAAQSTAGVGGGGAGGAVGGGNTGGSAGGMDNASVYSVDRAYGGRKLNAQVPPTAQPRVIPLEQRDLHRCEGAIRSLGRENGRRILVCDIIR